MALQLKIESLRARGEFNSEERDRLIAALKSTPPVPVLPKKRLVTPLRIFLTGMALGVGITTAV